MVNVIVCPVAMPLVPADQFIVTASWVALVAVKLVAVMVGGVELTA